MSVCNVYGAGQRDLFPVHAKIAVVGQLDFNPFNGSENYVVTEMRFVETRYKAFYQFGKSRGAQLALIFAFCGNQQDVSTSFAVHFVEPESETPVRTQQH